MISTIRWALIDYWEVHRDPRTVDFPIVGGGPTAVCSILGVWLFFVLYAGPKFMQNRPAYTLRLPILFYNTFMIVSNVFLFVFILSRIDYGRRFFRFEASNTEDRSPETISEIRIFYFCYLTRILDLLDTIFFVLRKKQSQVTFLHVYHHTAVPYLGYLFMSVAPQAPSIILFLLFNTFIHSIMYLYYTVASFGPKFYKYLWWKRYITQLQLAQFVTCGLLCTFMAWRNLISQVPAGLFWMGFVQNPFFFYMFYRFYQKSYQPKDKPKLS